MRLANSIGNEIWSNPTHSDLTDYYRYVNELKPWTVQVTGNFGDIEGMTKNAQQWQPQLIGLLHGKSASEEYEAFFIWPHGHMAQGEW